MTIDTAHAVDARRQLSSAAFELLARTDAFAIAATKRRSGLCSLSHAHGRREVRTESTHLAAPTARQQCDVGASGSKPNAARAACCVESQRDLIRQRMTDELAQAHRAHRRTASRRAADTARDPRRDRSSCTRPCRHAHTCGLTYWTVRMPRSLSCGISRRLNSFASTPT